MKPIAIFYHCRVRGGAHPQVEISPGNICPANPPIDGNHADSVMGEQMNALNKSGLLAAARELVVGCNGSEEECASARVLAGPRATFFCHGLDSSGEIKTLKILEDWSKTHRDHVVLYHHSKGVCWPGPGGTFRRDWRRCLTWALVFNWKRCVADLERGFDMVGGHWLTPETYRGMEHLKEPIWGGNFFWANASFLADLPPLSNRMEWHSRWDAEHWVGHGRKPVVKDYCPHWPDPVYCAKNANLIRW